ncbi:cache domain-containing protein [Iodobacter arcticus]|uniref:Cache domain-containing protein n=1 Tax=Iodobacter arcticus TaxID=590593 RepID=A0ABW2QYT5_9NEIS
MMMPAIAKEDERGGRVDAENMVKKAIAYLNVNGPQESFAAFTAPSQAFVDKDIYIAVYDRQGVCRAHGQTAKMVGKNFMNIVDISGKEYIKERIKLAASQQEFWHQYKFTDPISKKILKKDMFCKNNNQFIVCAGVYFPDK